MQPIKWEYFVVGLGADPLVNREILNQAGKDGWELVQMVQRMDFGWFGYLKRPYVETPPPLRVVPRDGA